MSIKATPESQELSKILFNKNNKTMTTEQKHEIEILGLPKGWRAVAYRVPVVGVDHILTSSGVVLAGFYRQEPWLIVEKIKPRRIVLEDTGEVRQPKEGEYVFNNGNLCLCRKPERWGNEHQIWRLVE